MSLIYCNSRTIYRLTELAAADGVKNTGIRVNAIAPGVVETPMTSGYYFEKDAVMGGLRDAVANLSPVGGGHIVADDIADVVAFLASDQAKVRKNWIYCHKYLAYNWTNHWNWWWARGLSWWSVYDQSKATTMAGRNVIREAKLVIRISDVSMNWFCVINFSELFYTVNRL